MKIILLRSIENLGKKFDVKNVKPGYARNFLIPQKLAIPANIPNLNWQKKGLENIKREKERLLKVREALGEKIKGLVLEIRVKTGVKGELFEKINQEKIARLLKEKGFEVDKSSILLKEPLSKIGEYSLKIKLEEGIETKVKLIISKEGKEKRI
ncbi:MAG: 50S ribosomal protein L9 [Patescibacteria group bacterium]